jgi:hypothetical protein
MTFRETIPWTHDFIHRHQPKAMYMYCTGGIRCTRLSAYIYSQALSFNNTPQLYVVRNREKNLLSFFLFSLKARRRHFKLLSMYSTISISLIIQIHW